MRRAVPLSVFLLVTLVGACAQPTPEATLPPSPSPVSETPEVDLAESPVPQMPATPATCEVFTLPPESPIPPVTEDDHVVGPDDASITFIEYADFECPACAGLHTLRHYLREQYGDDLRFVYRHLPLISMHDKALITAEATEAAAAQGKFWEMHDLLYERIQEWTPLSEEQLLDTLVEYARDLELDTERFEAELTEQVYRDQLLADYEAYQEYGLMATPSYVINNIFYPTREFGGFGQLEGFIGLVTMQERMYDSPPPQVLEPDEDYSATIRTSKGDIIVQLFNDQAPANVNSFAFLAQEGWYDGLEFFFVDHEQVALSGDPTNSGSPLPMAGYYCGDETTPDLAFDDAGLLAMYTGAPNQNSSSFFITYSPQPDLTGHFTIIGRVTEGMDVAWDLTARVPAPDQPEPDTIETIVIGE